MSTQPISSIHHFLEEFGWAHVPWDSRRILLYMSCSCVDWEEKQNELFWTSSTTGFYVQLTTILFLEIPGDMICLIRWSGWCTLVPVNGFGLLPRHFLELSLKGTNIPLAKETPLVVSSSCQSHVILIPLIFKVFISILLAHGCELRGAGMAFRKLPNRFLEVVPPKGKCPPFFSRVLLGACALKLLPYLIVYVLVLCWLWSKMNDFELLQPLVFMFNKQQSCSWEFQGICLIRRLGWRTHGLQLRLMPYHFLELSPKGTNKPHHL